MPLGCLAKMVAVLVAGVQQQNSLWVLRRANLSSSIVWPLLILLLTISTYGARGQQLDPATCYLEDAQLRPPSTQQGTCNATCRADTLMALQGIYDKLGGPTWNFNVDDEPGVAPNQGGWMQCPARGCRPDTV
jgi:hypothetical protein